MLKPRDSNAALILKKQALKSTRGEAAAAATLKHKHTKLKGGLCP